MCFSATASFGASVVLTTIGVAAINKSKGASQIMFASIPLLFGVQQLTEGFLWLALPQATSGWMQQVPTYIFLFFAQVAWPVFIPLSMYRIEHNAKNKAVLKWFILSGSIVSLCLAICLIYYPVGAKISGYHIFYEQNYPYAMRFYGGFFYIVSTIAPAFFCSIKRMWTIGAAILISYFVTRIFYNEYVISVWCFFAAIISVAVLHVLTNMVKDAATRWLPLKIDLTTSGVKSH